jgi:predicted small secreted protein
MANAMRYLALIALATSLVSCNTTIGLYRDTKAAVLWTKGKFQGTGGDGGGGGGFDEEYGAPVY